MLSRTVPAEREGKVQGNLRETPIRLRSPCGVLHAVLYQDMDASCRRGLLVCNPFAAESIFARRSLVSLARAVARQGVAVLRFDYVGTGDSEGAFEAAGIESRLKDLETAWRYLKGLPGLEHAGVFGLRLGGTLAALAAARGRIRPDWVVLADPVSDLKACLNQALRTNVASQTTSYRKVLRNRQALVSAIQEGEAVAVVGGFPLGKVFYEEASALDPAGEMKATAAVVFTATVPEGADPPPEAARLLQAYEAAGTPAAYVATPGQKIWELPRNYFDPPETLIRAVLDHLDGPPARHTVPEPEPGGTGKLDASDTAFARSEVPMQVNPPSGHRLSGILHHPAGGPSRSEGVMLVELGVGARMGMHRFNVRLARRLARMGYAVTRVDPTGVGDSEGRLGPMPRLHYYDAIESGLFTPDLKAILQAGIQETGIETWHVYGHCGGAMAIVQALHSEDAVKGLVLTDMPFIPSLSPASQTQTKVVQARSWLRALTFRSNYRYLLGRLLVHLREKLKGEGEGPSSPSGDTGSRVKTDRNGFNTALVAGFRTLIRRRREIFLVFSSGDRAIQEFLGSEETLTGLSDLTRRPYKIHTVMNANHTFFLQESQEAFMSVLLDWFETESARTPGESIPTGR